MIANPRPEDSSSPIYKLGETAPLTETEELIFHRLRMSVESAENILRDARTELSLERESHEITKRMLQDATDEIERRDATHAGPK